MAVTIKLHKAFEGENNVSEPLKQPTSLAAETFPQEAGDKVVIS